MYLHLPALANREANLNAWKGNIVTANATTTGTRIFNAFVFAASVLFIVLASRVPHIPVIRE